MGFHGQTPFARSLAGCWRISHLVLLQAVLIPCSLLLPGSRVLQLPDLQLSSSGTYTCMALNVGSQDQKSFILTVHGEC